MNCFSRQRPLCATQNPARLLARRSWLVWISCLAGCGAPVAETQARADDTEYAVRYLVTPIPGEQQVDVEVVVEQRRHLLREMRFDSRHVSEVRGDGELTESDGRVIWRPPEDGGRLSWRISVAHKRNGNGFDAWLGGSWGLFRAEDVIPRATTRTLKGATGKTQLKFDLPRSWSVVTEYAVDGGQFPIEKRGRRFSQPSGWIVMGQLGVRRERIAGVRVAIAGPENQQIRRLDMLAMLNWTLPELDRLLPSLPPRLTIISSGEPMWRGGLSAPQSIFIHAERPLISENGTSTLLHELMHVALGLSAERGYDWIVEGLAEYYSLELLHRSGTLSSKRHQAALGRLASWAESARTLCSAASTGATTALAVVKLNALNAEIKTATMNKSNLDDVLRSLLDADTSIQLLDLQSSAADIIGQKSDVLHIDNLPGCRKLALAGNSS